MSFTRDNVPARRVAQAVGLGGIAVGIVAVVSMFHSRPINLLIAAASFVPLLIAVTAAGLVVSLVFRRW
ncbi:MAG: endonuclease/exonuclease/phosphatase family protein, partial [Rhodococcus sp. (in: high G+C Gram-positive bacteria)]